jgi:putative oxidoreductase
MVSGRLDWPSLAALLARLLLTFMFAADAAANVLNRSNLSGAYAYYAFPLPDIVAWASAVLPALLALAFLTGIGIRVAAVIAMVFICLIAFMNGREGNQLWFGASVDRASLCAAMLYVLAFGPGRFALNLRRRG